MLEAEELLGDILPIIPGDVNCTHVPHTSNRRIENRPRLYVPRSTLPEKPGESQKNPDDG